MSKPKGRFYRLLAAFICAIILANAVCITAFAESGRKSEWVYYVNPLYADEEQSHYSYSHEVYSSGDSAGSVPYFDTLEGSLDYVRQQFANREATISFSSRESVIVNGSVDHYMDLVCQHTGNPVFGDYIAWSYGSASVRCSYDGVTYTNTLYISYYTTAEQEKELDDAINRLYSELDLDGCSDYRKVRKIYDYITENVTYDYDNLNNSSYKLKHTAYAALINGTAVCQGYALLFYRLCLMAGVDARYIASSDHGWNIVRLDGRYYNVDSTWDAEYLEVLGRYNYFLKSMDTFENNDTGSHTRLEEYDTDEFNAAYPMSDTAFSYEEVSYSFSNGVLTVNAEYDFPLPKKSVYSWSRYKGAATEIVVTGSPGFIPSSAFSGFTRVTAVTLPDSVERIGDKAFYGCSSLSGVNMPSRLKEIGDSSFSNTSLSTVMLPDGFKLLGDNAFSGSSLTMLSIPDSTALIGSRILFGNKSQSLLLYFPDQCKTDPNMLSGLSSELFVFNSGSQYGNSVPPSGDAWSGVSSFYLSMSDYLLNGILGRQGVSSDTLNGLKRYYGYSDGLGSDVSIRDYNHMYNQAILSKTP